MKAPLLALAIRTATGLVTWSSLAETSPKATEKNPFPDIRPARIEAEGRSDQIGTPPGKNKPQVRIVVEKPAALETHHAAGRNVILPDMPFITEPRFAWRERITPKFIIRSWYELWLIEECDSGVILVRLNF